MISNLYKAMHERQQEAILEYRKQVKELVEGKYFRSGSTYIYVKSVQETERGWTDSGVVFNITRFNTKDLTISTGKTNFGHYIDETYVEISKEDFEKGVDKLAQNLKGA